MESMNDSGFNHSKLLTQEETIQELLDRLSLEKVGPCQDKDHHLIRFFPPVLIPPPEAKNDSQLTNANAPTPNPFSGEKFIETCDCQNCTNRRDVSALVNEFDDKKAQMIKELNGMKSETDQLDVGFMQLNSRINALTVASIDVEEKLVAGYQDDKKSDSISAHDMGDGDFYPKPRGPTTQTFQNDVRTLKKYQNVLNQRLCEKQKESELDINNNHKPEMMANPHQLEIQLQRAHESNHYMLDKMKHLENIVKVLVGTTDVYGKNEKDLAEVTALMEDDPEAALQKLRLMKDAFETNHNLIMNQREKLHCQSLLISKYDGFVTDMQQCMNDYFRSPIAFQENADLMQRFGQLYACVKQVITDNGLLSQKLEALHNVQESISRENSLLNETVSSLNDHIEELSQENDKLMLQFRFNNKSCPPGCECMVPLLQSNNSTARTPDIEIKQVDDITFKFNFLSPPPSSSYFPQAHSTSAICPPPTPASTDCGSEADIFNNNFATNYVNNLKRVAQCLEDLKNSSYILSPDTSLNPHPVMTTCSTPTMTSLESSPLSSSRR